MESHMIATQQQNEQAVIPKPDTAAPPISDEGTRSSPAPIVQLAQPDAANPAGAVEKQQRKPGHPDALPLSNSPRKENQFAESPGNADLPSEASERNPLAPSDNSHNRLFKCLECGKRFPSHARLARHLYVCHRALIEGIAETKGQVAFGTRTIPVSQTTSVPVSPVKMAQSGNHLCRLCNRTFTFSSNLRRHIRKMHLQSPSKNNAAFQQNTSLTNSSSDTADKLRTATSNKLICDLCGQTYLTATDLDKHLRDMHQVVRKKLMFGAQQQNQKRSSDGLQPIQEVPLGFPMPAPPVANPMRGKALSNLSVVQNLLTGGSAIKPLEQIRTSAASQLDLSVNKGQVVPIKNEVPPISIKSETPDKSAPMDLSFVKKEDSPGSQPVDLTVGSKQQSANENTAVDLSTGSHGNKEEAQRRREEDDKAKALEASRSLLRAALQAKQDAKQQHPKLVQLLGNSGAPVVSSAAAGKPASMEGMMSVAAGMPMPVLEGLVSQSDIASTFSPLLMAAQMNLGFPANSLAAASLAAGGLPHFPGAPPMFGAPFNPYSLKRKLSGDSGSQLSPKSLDDDYKAQKPAKRRKSSANQSYEADGAKSPSSQMLDSSMIDPKFPSKMDGKRYICCLCGASFTFQTNLTRHQRKLHGKPYVRRPVAGQAGSPSMVSGSPSMVSGSPSMVSGSPSMISGSPSMVSASPSMLPSSSFLSSGSPSMVPRSPSLASSSPSLTGSGAQSQSTEAEHTTPNSSPKRAPPAMAYDVPPTPPIFGPVLTS